MQVGTYMFIAGKHIFIAGTYMWEHTGRNSHIDCRYAGMNTRNLVCAPPWQQETMAGHCVNYQSMAVFQLIQMYASEAHAFPSNFGNLDSHRTALSQTG